MGIGAVDLVNPSGAERRGLGNQSPCQFENGEELTKGWLLCLSHA